MSMTMANLPSLTPTNFSDALAFAEALAKSTMVPREYQRQPANILLAIQWGAELGLGPLQALQSIAVINGKPAVYGDAMLALVRGSPLCEDVIESIRGTGDEVTAVCTAARKGAAPVTRTFSVADAKRAGLWNKAGPWPQYPLRMLQMRAAALFARCFPRRAARHHQRRGGLGYAAPDEGCHTAGGTVGRSRRLRRAGGRDRP
jgi:hypothetical protein